MKLASLNQGRDGQLIVVNTALSHYIKADTVATTLQAALDNWANCKPKLELLAQQLESGEISGAQFLPEDCASPLPRAFHWVDGSAYVNHVELVRKARGAEMPESFWTDPLMYQGGSDTFLAPHEAIPIGDESWGLDLEAEVAVVVDDVPMGINPGHAAQHIKLIMLVNDVSLRNLIPAELAKGFGFYQAKPSSSFSPTAVTPDELGDAWDGKKLHLPLRTFLNAELIGEPNAGVDMTFDFAQLIAHAAKTRPLGAGTIIGSGTVSNTNRSSGSCCLAEIRMLEIIEQGSAETPFMKAGDRVQIHMLDSYGKDIFGEINQVVTSHVR